MGRFDDLLTNTVAQPLSTGGFDDLLQINGNNENNRFGDLVETTQQGDGIFQRTLKSLGGAVGALGRVLSTSQQATTGLMEKGLEKIGILKPKTEGLGIVEGIKEQKSNVELLKRIGEEQGGGLLTGQYTPSTNIFGNFVKELPVTTLGVLGDVFIDPLYIVASSGKIAKVTSEAGRFISEGAKTIAEEIPAVQKIGDMLGKAFITRFGQRPEFQALDIGRKIEESLAQEKVAKLVSPIIEKPAVIQQRITQLIKGEEEVSQIPKELEPLATEARKFKNVEEFVNKGKLPFLPPIRSIQTPKQSLEIFDLGNRIEIRQGFAKTDFQRKYGAPDTIINRRFSAGQIQEANKYVDDLTKGEKIISDKNPFTFNSLTDFYNQTMKKNGKFDITDNELKILAEPIREELDRVGESISKLNPKLLNPETFEANKGTYFPRLYTDYEFPEAEKNIQQMFGSRAVNIPKEPFKARILTEAESLAKGTRIEEAGLPALKRLTQLNIVESRQKFFSEVAKLASEEARPGLIQLSEDKALGKLAGKFLPVAEYKAIADIRHIPSETERIYNKALTVWKTFKTAYSPSTISRNDLTNYFILNPLGGVGPHRLDIYARTANELYTKGPMYQLARKEGLEISTQQAAELTNKAARFYKENQNLVGQFFGKIGDFNTAVKNFYGSQDKFFKLANFIKGVQEDGLMPYEAMRRANFYMVDYSEVPKTIEWLRKSPVGIPFISFTYGVTKPLAKTLLERPDKLAAYFKILNGIQQMNPMGETLQERQKELNVAPDWIQEGTYLRLPFKDKFGRGQYVDLQYILPINILESKSILPSNPVLNIIASILVNKDTFTGREVAKTTDTPLEKTQKYVTTFLAQLLPSFAPFVGTSYDKLLSALQQRPDRNGFIKSKLEAFVDILGGIKITPIDPTIEAQKRAFEKQKELGELHSQLKQIMLNKALFPEERQQESEKVLKKIQGVSGQPAVQP